MKSLDSDNVPPARSELVFRQAQDERVEGRPDPARVEEIFHAAAELPEHEQLPFLAQACSGDARLESSVRALLVVGRDAATAWERNAVDLEAQHSARAAFHPQPGEFFGPYRIVRRIAAGGMGAVYEAVRDDAEFHKRVAIKFVHHGIDDAGGVERFRRERQILAELEHPNIARLLDGGTTDDGIPFLVMEFVEGVPIDQFAADRGLTRTDRLNLVLQVADAVQYAHRNLVVHRDLKPANILVGADGVPKLLDFGIAKLLSSDVPSQTTTVHALTPAYASPEQVLGRSVGTGSDVYSLGVLLFVLLAERLPYDGAAQSGPDLVRAICERDPLWQPPGRIHGDLRSILAQALRKEPERRYLSVDQFAADVRRYMDGLPVSARPDTLAYRARKFVVRRALPLSAATAILVAVVAGTVATVAQSRRAGRRFNEVRALANTLIFKVHDAVAPLAGSTPVRQMIINEGLAYLERLTGESGGYPQLQLEIGRAYNKIGSVQGLPSAANLGDRPGAISSFQKAEAILRPMAVDANTTAEVVRAYVDATSYLTETLVQGVSPTAEVIAPARRGIDVSEAFVRRNPRSDEGRLAVAAAYFAAARVHTTEELSYLEHAKEIYRQRLADRPDDPARQRSLALAEKYVGTYYDAQQDYRAALVHHQAALRLDEQRARNGNDDRLVQFDLAIDLSNVGYEEWHLGQFEEAAGRYERSLRIREQLAASDPKDVLARAKVAFMQRQLGRLRKEQGLRGKAHTHLREALNMYASLDTSTLDAKHNLALTLLDIGQTDPDRADACRSSTKAFELFNTMTERQLNTFGDPDAFPTAARDAAACGVTQAQQWLQTSAKAKSPPGR